MILIPHWWRRWIKSVLTSSRNYPIDLACLSCSPLFILPLAVGAGDNRVVYAVLEAPDTFIQLNIVHSE